MVGLAVGLLQDSLAGLPSSSPPSSGSGGGLLPVNMRAGRATSAAVCRRCCLGQVRGWWLGEEMDSVGNAGEDAAMNVQ